MLLRHKPSLKKVRFFVATAAGSKNKLSAVLSIEFHQTTCIHLPVRHPRDFSQVTIFIVMSETLFHDLPAGTLFYRGLDSEGGLKILRPRCRPVTGQATSNLSDPACTALALMEVCCAKKEGWVRGPLIKKWHKLIPTADICLRRNKLGSSFQWTERSMGCLSYLTRTSVPCIRVVGGKQGTLVEHEA